MEDGRWPTAARDPARPPDVAPGSRFRRVLWVALLLNLAMFLVEVISGLGANSTSLLADGIDFAGDAANYALSLAVLSMSLAWRARAAMIKGLTMGAFGVFILGKAAWVAFASDVVPEPVTMGVVAALALAVNVLVAVMLYAFRAGDANMRSVWLCSRNDAIGNIAVGIAALGVFGTGTAWPDLLVACLMALLALTAAAGVARQARRELSTSSVPAIRGETRTWRSKTPPSYAAFKGMPSRCRAGEAITRTRAGNRETAASPRRASGGTPRHGPEAGNAARIRRAARTHRSASPRARCTSADRRGQRSRR